MVNFAIEYVTFLVRLTWDSTQPESDIFGHSKQKWLNNFEWKKNVKIKTKANFKNRFLKFLNGVFNWPELHPNS